MFKAYLNRSELGDPAAVMAVCGYLSSDEHWQQFEHRERLSKTINFRATFGWR